MGSSFLCLMEVFAGPYCPQGAASCPRWVRSRFPTWR